MGKVREIMVEFSHLTGLSGSGSGKPPKRYLWTDAFAVCNYLELYRQTREEEFLDLVLRLVAQVHQILGRHRSDDSRKGWISGLGEEEGSRHPTLGGLRIGKPLPERRIGEAYNAELEWDRDGQYFHYLTKWMQALNQISRAVEKLEEFMKSHPEPGKTGPSLRARIDQLSSYGSFREQIESFWLDRRNRAVQGWTDHREINLVMLATSLAPDGYFTLSPGILPD